MLQTSQGDREARVPADEPSTGVVSQAEVGSDRALARRAGMGDDEAFTVLFARYFQPSFRFALHMLDGDQDAAADASQQAWIKVWRHLPSFRGDSTFQTWLFSIAAREVIEHRRRRRPVPLDDEALELQGNRESADDPVEVSLNRELWDSLTLALRELPWRQRASWILREMDGLSYAEIAVALETTPTVVRGQLHRARRALSIRMEQWR